MREERRDWNSVARTGLFKKPPQNRMKIFLEEIMVSVVGMN